MALECKIAGKICRQFGVVEMGHPSSKLSIRITYGFIGQDEDGKGIPKSVSR
jgi:hypothetical protein